tara:strand:- start:637 stop:2562 length:1926 start_codon:yes stop_codon:yes gene_type:complete
MKQKWKTNSQNKKQTRNNKTKKRVKKLRGGAVKNGIYKPLSGSLTKKQKRRTNKHYKKRRTNRKRHGLKRGGMNQGAAESEKVAVDEGQQQALAAAHTHGQAVTISRDGRTYHTVNLSSSIPEHLIFLDQLRKILTGTGPDEQTEDNITLLIEVAKFAKEHNRKKIEHDQQGSMYVHNIVISMMNKYVQPHVQLQIHVRNIGTAPRDANGLPTDRRLREDAIALMREFRRDSVSEFMKNTLLNVVTLGYKSVHTFKSLILTYFGEPTIKEIKKRGLKINETDEAIIFCDIYTIILGIVNKKINHIDETMYDRNRLHELFRNLIEDTIIVNKELNVHYLPMMNGQVIPIQGPEDKYYIDIVCKEFANIIMEMYRMESMHQTTQKMADSLSEKISPLLEDLKDSFLRSMERPTITIGTARALYDSTRYLTMNTVGRVANSLFDTLTKIQSASNVKEVRRVVMNELPDPPVYLKEGVDSAMGDVERAMDNFADRKRKYVYEPLHKRDTLKKHEQLQSDARSINFYSDFSVVLSCLDNLVFSLVNIPDTTDEDLMGHINAIITKIGHIIELGEAEEKEKDEERRRRARKFRRHSTSMPRETTTSRNLSGAHKNNSGFASDNDRLNTISSNAMFNRTFGMLPNKHA